MKKIFVILFLGGIGLYVYSLNNQISNLETICSLYPVGATADGISNIESEYSIKYMGPFVVNDKPGTMQAIFCAPLTICDVSCNLVYKNNTIIKSKVNRL